jgi:STE24 endopeptidase
MGARWWAWVTLGLLVLAVVVVAAIRVPWSAPPAPRADQLDAIRDLPAEAVARGKAFHAALRPG